MQTTVSTQSSVFIIMSKIVEHQTAQLQDECSIDELSAADKQLLLAEMAEAEDGEVNADYYAELCVGQWLNRQDYDFE